MLRRLAVRTRLTGSPKKRRTLLSLVVVSVGFLGVYYCLTTGRTVGIEEENKISIERGILGTTDLEPAVFSQGHSTPSDQSISPAQSSVIVSEDQPLNSGPSLTIAPEALECNGPWPNHSQCANKMKWMSGNWNSDPCYSLYGVDGTTCSFQRYLSEVEKVCPVLESHIRQRLKTLPGSPDDTVAIPQHDFQPLELMLAANKKFKWISMRISSHWKGWVAGHKMKMMNTPASFTRRKILLHSGVLSDKANHHYAEGAFKGGPLGELVQWADLITSVYLLGHHITLSTEISQLTAIIFKPNRGGCLLGEFDTIYVDIVGLKQFRDVAKDQFSKYLCKFRVLDTFGTEPQFNYKDWKPLEFSDLSDKGQEWGDWNLNPRQTMTLYPHTPDNSFLGFVVGEFKRNATPSVKKNMAVVYGKEFYMWKNKQRYLNVIHNHLDIHGTIGQRKTHRGGSIKDVPPYVINHGVLKFTELQALLKKSKLFIGLGFPYEGPAPLEAIANGCFFLNPLIKPPLNRRNSEFMRIKPTLRAFTSQNPYAERFIAEPYVYTIDLANLTQVGQVMKDIMKKPTPPGYLPYEFTYEGMLERMAVYLQNQDFCRPHQWPGQSALITKISKPGEDCKQTCYDNGLVCEPELFSFLNTKEQLSKHFDCSSTLTAHSYHAPSHQSTTKQCTLQKDHLLLSCVGNAAHVTRICPCRKYRKGQVALCVDCIR